MREIPSGMSFNKREICPNCNSAVRMVVTHQGLTFCPVCGYSPELRTQVRSSTALESGCVLSGAPGVTVNMKDDC